MSFADPYIAIIRDDSSLLLLQADESGDLDEVALPEQLSSKWQFSHIYHDENKYFEKSGLEANEAGGHTFLLLMNPESNLSVSEFPSKDNPTASDTITDLHSPRPQVTVDHQWC